MSIDPISAIVGSAPAQAESTSQAAPGEFPSLLRSTLNDGESGNSHTDSKSDAPTEAVERVQGDAADAQTRDDSTPAESRSGTEQESAGDDGTSKPTESELETRAADAATLAAAASALAAQVRAGASTEAAVSNDGPPSALDADQASRGLPERGRSLAFGQSNTHDVEPTKTSEGNSTRESVATANRDVGLGNESSSARTVVVEETVSDHRSRQDAELEVLSNRAGLNERAQDVAAKQVALGESPQEVASRPVEQVAVGPELSTLSRGALDAETAPVREASGTQDNDQNNQDSRSNSGGNEGRPNDQALFDRAAEGSQSGGVDPILRQAIENATLSQRAPETIAVDGVGTLVNPIAGAVTETTPNATPGSPTPPAASDAIAVQTEWLASRGGGTVRLLLSPPSLGEIAIRVTLRGGVVDVMIVAQEALARSVAEEQSDRLAQAFSNRDLRMENFEVRRGDPQDLTRGDLSQFSDSGTHREGQSGDDEASGMEDSRASLGGTSERADTERTLPPEILSAAPESGVDLRI